MAGALGFEPRSSVLETDSLTVELTPPYRENALPALFHLCRGLPANGTGPESPELLGFLVRRVLAAAIAELRELKPAGGRLLVLRRRVITLLTDGALQCHDFTHNLYYPFKPAILPNPSATSMANT